MKKSILFFAFLFVSTISFAELEFVYFKIEYNEATDLFDCKMFLEGGFATSVLDRTQFDAQYSIVAETGTTVTVAETFLPIYNNENYTGTVPVDWQIENMAINPSELPGYDIFGIILNIGAQPAHYNDLSGGDEITLFSLSVVGGDICSISLRIFENDVDPTNIGSGDDFSNGMMVGSTDQTYIDNFISNDVWTDVDITINGGTICEGECITLTSTFNCIFPGLTYEWSTGETSESITVCPEVSQEYILFLSAPFEYGSEVTTYITVDQGIIPQEGTDICVGVPIFYLPEHGIWTSSDDNIATVTNDGYITPISQGTATITHTTLAGNCPDEVVVTVLDPEPPTIIGDVEICTNETTQLSPSTGVTWVSGNSMIATVDNTGVVTGVGIGATVFTYTTNQGQCVSDPSPSVNVLIIPEPKITGRDTICMHETTTLTPSAGVIWESSDISVAKIDNSGNVTGISEGTTTFSFTDLANACTSDESEPVTILPSPMVQLSADSVCQGENVLATTNFEGGSWMVTVISGQSNNPTVDSVTGEIETTESGLLSVQYISEGGCISDDSVLLTILTNQIPQVSTNSPLCIGENLILSADAPTGDHYEFTWYMGGNFLFEGKDIIVPNVTTDYSGTYTLVVTGNGCSNELVFDVIVEDCDPCEDMTTTGEWIKVPASMDNFPSIGDFEIGGSLVTGRELEDFVYYNESQEDIRLIKNTGNGYFEEEVVLFDLPYIGSIVKFDIVDINQDGLNDIVTYQSEISSGTGGEEVTITIFKNIDNYMFENSLNIIEESGGGYFLYNIVYQDIDNQGFFDIIPYFGSIYFTDGWEDNSINLPTTAASFIVEDFNEDGLLDIWGNDAQLFINNGDRTFTLLPTASNHISFPGLYDNETGVYIDGYFTYQITKGENPISLLCGDLAINNANSFFYANINSINSANGVITSSLGFHIFETPLTCENSAQYETNLDFIPNKEGIIDFTGNGYSDFITFENGIIYAWINPNEQPKLRGTAYIDNNGDGMLNENDSPLRNVLVSIEPGNLSVLTDDNGSYQFAVPEGTYTLTANVNEGEWIMDELMIENVEITDPCNLGYDFGFVPDPTAIPSVSLSMVNTIARCDFETRFTITVENTGTEPLETQLQFEFDDKTTFFSTEIAGASVIGNRVIADIGPLAPFQPQKYNIKVKMPNGSSVLPILDFRASLLNDMGEVITEYGYAEQLRCSYDPNDKREFPDREGDDNLTLMDEDIEYTIRFQNNGNDTAYNVKIVDPLDSNIEPSSIRVVGSSHNVETCIEGTDLIFLFENIYLVDSTTDYPSSQGYVTFKCNTKEDRAEFTMVNNTADIFFDTNLPISTNQTLNTLVSVLCTDKSTVIDKYICDGEVYLGHTESGTYTESFELLFGCDSLVTINLTVQGITYSQQSIDVCGDGIDIAIGVEVYYIDSSTTLIDTVYNDQGCISNILKFEITVVLDLIDLDALEFCINETGSFFSNFNGIWSSDDESVFTVDNQGNIITVNPGSAILQFFDSETGCIDELSVVVHPDPILNNEGSDQICITESNQLTTDTDGIWSSSDPEVATITNDGLVIGKEAGTVTFIFTSMTTGCTMFIEMVVLPSSDSNCTVSTNELSPKSINIYPNPATGSIFIESIEKWNSIKVINAQGQVVLSSKLKEYQSKKQIDLNKISSGLYFLYIERESGIVVRRFVVD